MSHFSCVDGSVLLQKYSTIKSGSFGKDLLGIKLRVGKQAVCLSDNTEGRKKQVSPVLEAFLLRVVNIRVEPMESWWWWEREGGL